MLDTAARTCCLCHVCWHIGARDARMLVVGSAAWHAPARAHAPPTFILESIKSIAEKPNSHPSPSQRRNYSRMLVKRFAAGYSRVRAHPPLTRITGSSCLIAENSISPFPLSAEKLQECLRRGLAHRAGRRRAHFLERLSAVRCARHAGGRLPGCHVRSVQVGDCSCSHPF